MQDAAVTSDHHRETRHATIEIDGIEIFYREAGPRDAPVLFLPHGYPCSSYEFRNLMPALADRWRLIAPDYPGFGYSATPDGFAYDYEGYSQLLERFADSLGLKRFALYLHDYGTWIGLKLARRAPDRITGLIIQNGDIYEDALGPKYEGMKEYWRQPTPEGRKKLEAAVSEDGFREEFLNEVRAEIAGRIPPDLWKLHWPLMNTQKRRKVSVGLMEVWKENFEWFPRYQAYLREHQPPTLIVWGPQDGYMPEKSARAYLRDLPHAELHLLDGGHWLLETSLDEVVALIRPFLSRLEQQPESRRLTA